MDVACSKCNVHVARNPDIQEFKTCITSKTDRQHKAKSGTSAISVYHAQDGCKGTIFIIQDITYRAKHDLFDNYEHRS